MTGPLLPRAVKRTRWWRKRDANGWYPAKDYARSAEPFVRISVLGRTLHLAKVVSENDIEAAFAALVQERAAAVCCAASEFPNLAPTSHRVGAMPRIASFSSSDFVAAGGMMSYGSDQLESYRGAGVYAGRILSAPPVTP